MNPPIKLLSVASDFHCGSSVGLMPPAYKTLEGFTVKASPFQLWLWECWLDWNQFVKEVKGCDPMATVLNGDCTEGVHHGTKQIVSADHADHNGIAIRGLRPLADISDKLYIITGTEVHVGSGENSIGHALKAQINPDFPPCEEGDEPPAGAYTFQRLSLNLNGVRVIARHHMSTSIRRGLSGTPLSNALSDEQVEAVNNGEELPRVLLLAHSHVSRTFTNDNGLVVVTGAWQGPTRFTHKVVSSARCKPSGYLLDCRGKQQGELPLVHHRIYNTPPGTTIDL